MVVLLLTSVAPAAASEGCSNEARREEQGAAGRALPDCRAYELVTPSYTPSPEYRDYFQGVAPLARTFLAYESPMNSLTGCPAWRSVFRSLATATLCCSHRANRTRSRTA